MTPITLDLPDAQVRTHSRADSPSLSAREIHEVLLTAHAGNSLARRRFIDGLRALHESRLYLQLGFSDVAAYADATFRYRRSQVYEFLRVSRALLDLPQIASAFEHAVVDAGFAKSARSDAVRGNSHRAAAHATRGI